MKIGDQLSSSLPKINLKMFDKVRNNYGSLPSFFQTHQQMRFVSEAKQVKQNVNAIEKCQQKNKLKIRDKKSETLHDNSQQKPKYQTKQRQFYSRSLSFHKSLSKASLNKKVDEEKKLTIDNNNSLQKKANIRLIDTQFIMESMPRLKMSKSQPKIKITTNTKYENWFPKKNKLRQMQAIRNQNFLKLQKFQDSFFFKCRDNSSLLKLTKSQELKI